MKKTKKILLSVPALLLLFIVCYLLYALVAYHRIADNLEYSPDAGVGETPITVGEEHSVVSWNIGFGAYTADFGFFMDGGDSARAASPEALESNMESIIRKLSELQPELLLLQEVDTHATRSHHRDEVAMLRRALSDYHSAYVENYDSIYLLYPLRQPHGSAESGILTMSSYPIVDVLRVSLPIESGLRRYLDLDRCYSISRIPTDDGNELCLYNFHLSAYSADGLIADQQLELLLADMAREAEAGNYVIAGGDFNKDLLIDSSRWFGIDTGGLSWTRSVNASSIAESGITLVAPLNEDAPVPSVRNADGPYNAGQIVLTVDGFLTSLNVRVLRAEVLDTAFAFSDHNPVRMSFVLG